MNDKVTSENEVYAIPDVNHHVITVVTPLKPKNYFVSCLLLHTGNILSVQVYIAS